MMADTVADAEFERWVPLAHAVRILNHGTMSYPHSTIESIKLRLADDSIALAAEKATWREPNDQRRILLNARLHDPIWKRHAPDANDRFWRTGDAEIFLSPDLLHGYKISASNISSLTIIGARLAPDDVQRLALSMGIDGMPHPDAAPPPENSTTKRRQDLPQLPDQIAQAWAAWFKASPGASKQAAEAAAIQMFPNHNLSRDRIRELMGDSVMGRPKKTAS